MAGAAAQRMGVSNMACPGTADSSAEPVCDGFFIRQMDCGPASANLTARLAKPLDGLAVHFDPAWQGILPEARII